MRIVFTKEDRRTVRKTLDGFRQSYIIDAREILLGIDYQESYIISTSQDYIINKEMERKLSQAISNKKSQQVVYFHHSITPDLIKNIKHFFKTNSVRPTYVVYDPLKELKPMWRLFDEVIQ